MDLLDNVGLQEGDTDQWIEGNFAYYSSVVLNSPFAVSSLCFDPVEELLWTANANGRIASYYSAGLDRHTAWIASDGDIRSLDVDNDIVLSLSANALRANTKQGLSMFNYSTQNMINMSAMHRLSDAPNSVILGGEQNKLLQFDIENQREQRMVILKQKDATIIRSNNKYVFTGDSEGNISVRAPGSMDAVRVIPAHGGPLSDFDVCGNKLITCGCSLRMNSLHGDPYMQIYDLRTFQALPPLPLSFAPVFTRFMPTYTDSRVVIVSQMGELQITDLNKRAGVPMLVETGGFPIYAFHMSPSKQCLAFGDESGAVYLYADHQNPVFNENPWDTEFADPPLALPCDAFTIDDTSQSLAKVPLPFSSDEDYLSDWPTYICEPAYRKARPLPTYTDLRQVQFVGYAANPRATTPFRHFNICPYDIEEEEGTQTEDDLIDLNSSVRSSVPPGGGKTGGESSECDDECGVPVIPIYYKKLPVKRNRLVMDDPSLRRYNRTDRVAIESTPACAHVNPVVALLYHVSTVRWLLMCHVCEKEHCMCCELGFLFRMLADKSPSQPASSHNLVRALRGAGGDASAIPDQPAKIQLAFNSIVACLDKSLSEEERGRLEDVLETELAVNSRCIRCGEVRAGEEKMLSITLNYVNGAERLPLGSLIEKRLNSRGQCEAACAACAAPTRTEQTKRVKRLPKMMLIDTNTPHPGFRSFWTAQLNANERRPKYNKPANANEGVKERACRYGADCRNRPYCKYSHGITDWEQDCATWLDEKEGETGWQHVLPSKLYARVSDGICIMSAQTLDDENAICYELVGVAASIGDTHAVAEVREHDSGSWLVLNELAVTRVSENEALHMSPRWKLPVLLCYVDTQSDLLKTVERRAEISADVFLQDSNLTGNDELARMRRELPQLEKGAIVGIDAEFINMSKDCGRKSVGRVSVVDENGVILVDDYVVTCDGDVVDDYLTQYSGISASDLDPAQSTKHLTTLKRVYLKILHLIEKGCVFVGHALHNDFNVLNIYVPPKQMQDTVHLFHLPQQRMISLQFLAWHLLGEKIQEGTHDSVEDARVALQLYSKWKELKAEGVLEERVHGLYEIGKASNWRLDGSPSKHGSASPSVESIGASQSQ